MNHMNTSLIKLRISQNKKAEKFHRKIGNPTFEQFHKELKEQFQECLDLMTGNITGYLKSK